MDKCMTLKEIERLNRIIRKIEECNGEKSLAYIARSSGYPVETIKKYYDEKWYSNKYYQETDIDPEMVYGAGLYLLAQQIISDGKIINLLKIGQSKTLNQRLSSYKTTNPFARCIDILECKPEELTKLEHGYHVLLEQENERFRNTEWFVCDDEHYNYWLNHKFNTLKLCRTRKKK